MQYINSREIHSAPTVPDSNCIRRETNRLLATLTMAERRWINDSESPLAVRARGLMAMDAALMNDPALQGKLCGVLEQIVDTKAAYNYALFRRGQKTLTPQQMGDALQDHIDWLEQEIAQAHAECERTRYDILKNVYLRFRRNVEGR